KIIGSVTPSHNVNNVDIYAVPTIANNIPLNESFGQLNEAGEEVLYKVEPANVKITGANNSFVNAGYRFGTESKSITLLPYQRLKPETYYTVSGTFNYLKKLSSGAWTPVL